ncbi:MAG: hypothetical protein ACRCYO_14460 [Bacteroidia bacterium]
MRAFFQISINLSFAIVCFFLCCCTSTPYSRFDFAQSDILVSNIIDKGNIVFFNGDAIAIRIKPDSIANYARWQMCLGAGTVKEDDIKLLIQFMGREKISYMILSNDGTAVVLIFHQEEGSKAEDGLIYSKKDDPSQLNVKTFSYPFASYQYTQVKKAHNNWYMCTNYSSQSSMF